MYIVLICILPCYINLSSINTSPTSLILLYQNIIICPLHHGLFACETSVSGPREMSVSAPPALHAAQRPDLGTTGAGILPANNVPH